MATVKSKGYRRIYEEHYGIILEPGLEVHHIDGNRSNNQIENLQAVTILEHLEIHKTQSDYGAVQAILMRLESGDISKFASLAQKKRWEEGRHNFQMAPDRRLEISRAVGLASLEKGTGIHAINANPELASANAKRAGLAAKAKKAGFHSNPRMGGDSVSGTVWWVNKSGHRIRSTTPPGLGWKKGMKWPK